jgi:predicted nucleic acid-binding protein
VTFDSNVLIYTLSRGDDRHLAAASLLGRATRAELGEALPSLDAVGFDPRQARQEIDGFRTAFPVVAADESDLERAMRAIEHHQLSFWDAMLWATAERAGCSLLSCEDFQDGRRLEGVLFVDPFAAENQRLVDLALPASRT